MLVEFQIEGGDEIADMFQSKSGLMVQAITTKLNLFNLKLQQKIMGKVEGDVLQHRTGKLARSIEAIQASQSGSIISARVQAGGGVAPYAKFQEEGTSGPYEIVAKGKALAFMVDGKQVFAKKVMHPGLTAKRFMAGSLEEMQDDLMPMLQDGVREVINS